MVKVFVDKTIVIDRLNLRERPSIKSQQLIELRNEVPDVDLRRGCLQSYHLLLLRFSHHLRESREVLLITLD